MRGASALRAPFACWPHATRLAPQGLTVPAAPAAVPLRRYEVIREGRPAHLYFDLEYPAQLNPQVGRLGLLACCAHSTRLHNAMACDAELKPSGAA